jgi:hypothetical protein
MITTMKAFDRENPKTPKGEVQVWSCSTCCRFRVFPFSRFRDTCLYLPTRESTVVKPLAALRGLRLLVLVGICVVLASCGRKGNIVPVSGRVTIDGQPLANVALNFGPLTGGLDGAYAAYGKTDADGRYTLKLVDDGRRGAAVGKNRVTLNEAGLGGESDGAAARIQFKLPPKARDGTMQFDVPPGGTNAADFQFGKAGAK